MNNILLSICIPTKDRYRTLMPVLSGLLYEFRDFNIELVVQDNTDDNAEILEFITKCDSKKIKYFHDSTSLSQSENCNQSVKNATGEFLILIGDDDYVLPTIIEAIEWMKTNNVECLNYNIASYLWSDISFKYQTAASKGGTLLLNRPISKEFISLIPKIELAKVLKSGGTDYAELPRLYHGVVKRSVLDKIYVKCNTYFPGLSPDMANSSALAIYTEVFYKYNFPLSVSGKSASSAAGKGVNHTHVGNLDEMTFLDKKLLAKWNLKIPYFWSGDTIYAQSILHSLEACDYGGDINYNRLYAHLLIFEWSGVSQKMDVVLKSIRENIINLFIILYWCLYYFTMRSINYLVRKVYPIHYYDLHHTNHIQNCVKIINDIASE